MTEQEREALPPLPEPEAYRHREETGPAWSYTADQMRDYARAAVSEANLLAAKAVPAGLAAHWDKLADQAQREGLLTAADAYRVCADQLRQESTPPAPYPADRVPMPTNSDQAAAMSLLGEAWLRANAPERLRATPPAPAPEAAPAQAQQADLLRLFTSYGNAMYRNDPEAAEQIAQRFSAALAAKAVPADLATLQNIRAALVKGTKWCLPAAAAELGQAIKDLDAMLAATPTAPAPEADK